MAAERCPANKDGQQCVLLAGHLEQHQPASDPGWAPPAPVPSAAPAGTAAPAPVDLAARPVEWGGVVILVAGSLAILGSFLPWIQATAAFVGTIARNGLDGGGDGILTIVLGILIGLLGIALLSRSGSPRTARVGAITAGVALGFLAYLDIGNVNDRIHAVGTTVTASVGAGLILVALAAVLAVIGALLPAGKRASR